MPIADKLLLNPETFKDTQILVVDNDRGSRDLYTCLLESYGAKVTALGSIKDTLDILSEYVPTLLICEMRFLGETVLPLIQQIRGLALSSDLAISILGISTDSLANLLQQVPVKIEAYLLKPIDLDCLADKVWNLILLSSIPFT